MGGGLDPLIDCTRRQSPPPPFSPDEGERDVDVSVLDVVVRAPVPTDWFHINAN